MSDPTPSDAPLLVSTSPARRPREAGPGPSRRTVLKGIAAGAGALALGPIPATAASRSRILGANDRVRVGVVGFSDRARGSLIPALLHHGDEHGFELVAVSDIWNRRRDEGKAFLEERAGRSIRAFRNNEELYESGEVDAVVISTADFQHALHCVEGVEAGCDVYVEKPFANRMDDARQALSVVEASDRIVQVGTQRRSAPAYQRAAELIGSGELGPVVMVEMSWNVNQPGRWRRPELVADLEESGVDWKRYLMNRPYEPFDPRKYIEYRLFWPYSSGIPGQWMVHQIDTVHWFTGLARPRGVVASGGIHLWSDGRRNADTLTAVFDYGPLDERRPGEGFQVVYSSRQTNSAGGVKELYYTNGGTIDLEANEVTPEGGLTERYANPMGKKPFQLEPRRLAEAGGVETAASTGVDGATLAHVENWMQCVRDRKQPNAPIRAAYDHSVALCMTVAALHSGRRADFDDRKQEVVLS